MHLPALNSSRRSFVIYRDGKKEISAQLANHLPNAMAFLCVHHALLSAFKALSGDDVRETMTSLVYALTVGRFNHLESDLSQAFRNYLSQNQHIEPEG